MGLIAFLALANNSVSAFSTAGNTRRAKTALFSAVVETEEVAVEQKPKQQQVTRFDRIKANYKGPRHVISADAEEEVGFSYASFDEAVAASDYSFNRNDIVKGTVVQYDNGGCIVDIGAKSSAFLPAQEAALVQVDGVSIESLIALDEERSFKIISEEDLYDHAKKKDLQHDIDLKVEEYNNK